MPVKRRTSKRRIDPQAEAEMWATFFATGFDFFSALHDVGIYDNDAARAAAPEAWARLGNLFLAARLGDDFSGENWAVLKFGEPGDAS